MPISFRLEFLMFDLHPLKFLADSSLNVASLAIEFAYQFLKTGLNLTAFVVMHSRTGLLSFDR